MLCFGYITRHIIIGSINTKWTSRAKPRPIYMDVYLFVFMQQESRSIPVQAEATVKVIIWFSHYYERICDGSYLPYFDNYRSCAQCLDSMPPCFKLGWCIIYTHELHTSLFFKLFLTFP